MKLPVQSALRVGYWRSVVNDRLPRHRFSPQERLYPDVQIRPGVREDFHRRPAIIEDAIHRVENRSVSSEAIGILIGADVWVGPVLQENTRAADRVELGTYVQRR